MELATTFTFEASHRLPNAPAGSKCSRLHGHSWEVEVHVAGELDPQRGWVMDYNLISSATAPLTRSLDHHHLNDIEGLENPTSELLAIWIWNHLAPGLAGLVRIVVHETCTARCTYHGPPSGRESG
ncbi:MAG: 6-carboxytetrahydropterin synthase QueD [Acidobacteriota bacterium]